MTHMTKQRPMDFVSFKTPCGEINIPEPMIVPTIKQMPENKPMCLLSVTSSVGSTVPNASA